MSVARRFIRIAAGLVGSGALALAGASAAGASSSAGATATDAPIQCGRIPVISVSMSTDGGFSLPPAVHAGLVTFKVSSPEAGYHALQGFRVNPGYTVDDVVHDLALGLSANRADNALGHQLLLVQAVLVGGVVTAPEGPISVTVQLEPATYYFFDLNDLFLTGVTPRVHRLDARGAMVTGGLPAYDTVITAGMTADGMPRFENAPAELRHDGTFLFVNAADELHEAVFRPTRDGITDEYITDFYNAIASGDPNPPASPWIGRQRGLQAISPNRWAIVHIGLNTGPNALICYVPSDEAGPPENGLPHAYLGMHNMLNLT
jgi:hypothetical protein